MEVKVNFQNSILINGNIYIDPLNISGECRAKYIFITHPHFDHFSINDIKKIATSETILICPQSMEVEVKNNLKISTLFVDPDQKYDLDDFSFETFKSYNIDKKFHPKENKWIGYTLNIDNEKVTIVGDSDVTSELKNLKTDILLIPIGGHFTMDFNEAALLTNYIHPKKVIPTHYGEIVGSKDMGQKFKKLINDDIVCELHLG